MTNFDRMFPTPPPMPKIVVELERAIASDYPTPAVHLVSRAVYEQLIKYLQDYEEFRLEMGWHPMARDPHAEPAIHGLTGLCFIRCADAN